MKIVTNKNSVLGYSLMELVVTIGILAIGVLVYMRSSYYNSQMQASLSVTSLYADINSGIHGIFEIAAKKYISGCRGTYKPAQSFADHVRTQELGAIGLLGVPAVFSVRTANSSSEIQDAAKRCNSYPGRILSKNTSGQVCFELGMASDYRSLLPQTSLMKAADVIVEARMEIVDLVTLEPMTCDKVQSSGRGIQAGLNVRYIVHWQREIIGQKLEYRAFPGMLVTEVDNYVN